MSAPEATPPAEGQEGAPKPNPQHEAAHRNLQMATARVNEVADIMHTNFEKVQERGKKLAELEVRAVKSFFTRKKCMDELGCFSAGRLFLTSWSVLSAFCLTTKTKFCHQVLSHLHPCPPLHPHQLPHSAPWSANCSTRRVQPLLYHQVRRSWVHQQDGPVLEDNAEGLHDIMCNHAQAISLFISSIENGACHLMGTPCGSRDKFAEGGCGSCPALCCMGLGIHADQFIDKTDKRKSISLYLNNTGSELYCVN